MGDLEAKLQYLKREAAKWGIALTGNTKNGAFSGSASGNYSASENEVVVTVNRIPFWVPLRSLENEFRRLLSE